MYLFLDIFNLNAHPLFFVNYDFYIFQKYINVYPQGVFLLKLPHCVVEIKQLQCGS